MCHACLTSLVDPLCPGRFLPPPLLWATVCSLPPRSRLSSSSFVVGDSLPSTLPRSLPSSLRPFVPSSLRPSLPPFLPFSVAQAKGRAPLHAHPFAVSCKAGKGSCTTTTTSPHHQRPSKSADVCTRMPPLRSLVLQAKGRAPPPTAPAAASGTSTKKGAWHPTTRESAARPPPG